MYSECITDKRYGFCLRTMFCFHFKCVYSIGFLFLPHQFNSLIINIIRCISFNSMSSWENVAAKINTSKYFKYSRKGLTTQTFFRFLFLFSCISLVYLCYRRLIILVNQTILNVPRAFDTTFCFTSNETSELWSTLNCMDR